MYKALIGALLILVLTLGAIALADAQVPQIINYQGKLTQADGSPVSDGTYTIKFTLYDAQSGGSSVWTETRTNISVTGGLFYTLLGETSALTSAVFPAGSDRWLGLKVGSDNEMTPRQKLASSPYALRSDTVSPGSIGSTELKSEAASLSKVSGGALTASGGNVSVTGTISGNGSGLTNLNGAQVGTGINGANVTNGTIASSKLASGVATAPGLMLPYGGSSAPTGWLMCDGSAVSRTTYAALFTAISTNYGTGDGSTTFNLPDMRQRFPLGKAASGTGSTLGGTGGAIDHTHTGPSHTHDYSDVISHTHSVDPPGTESTSAGAHTHTYSDSTDNVSAAHTHSVSATSSSVSHSHTVSFQLAQALAFTAGANYAAGTANNTVTSSSAGGHNHAFGGTTSGISANHTHTFSGATGYVSADHTHATDIAAFDSEATGVTTGTTAAGGTGATGTNNAPFQVVNYIIKS